MHSCMRNIFLNKKEVGHTKFDEHLESSKHLQKNVGLRPQALISHLKQNHNNTKTITNAKTSHSLR